METIGINYLQAIAYMIYMGGWILLAVFCGLVIKFGMIIAKKNLEGD